MAAAAELCQVRARARSSHPHSFQEKCMSPSPGIPLAQSVPLAHDWLSGRLKRCPCTRHQLCGGGTTAERLPLTLMPNKAWSAF